MITINILKCCSAALRCLPVLLMIVCCSCLGTAPHHSPSVTGVCRFPDSVQKATEATITNEPLTIANEDYRLEISRCRCGDSLTALISLYRQEERIFATPINYYSFSDSNDQFYDRAFLQTIRYDATRDDRLFFTAAYKNKYNESSMQTGFAIYYRTEKAGQMQHWLRRGNTNIASVTHTYGATGQEIRYVVNDTSVAVIYNCDFSDCKENTAYQRKLPAAVSHAFFKKLQQLQVDTLKKIYHAGFMDGHVARYTFAGPMLTNRSIELENVALAPTDSINIAIDRLILDKRYRFVQPQLSKAGRE